MKKLFPLFLLATLSAQAQATDVDPFMSAQAREQQILDERKKEAEKFSHYERFIQDKSASNTPAGQRGQFAEHTLKRIPYDLAFAGIKGNALLVRERNATLLLENNQQFMSNNELFSVHFSDAKNITIKRVSDEQVIFMGMVGSFYIGAENQNRRADNAR